MTTTKSISADLAAKARLALSPARPSAALAPNQEELQSRAKKFIAQDKFNRRFTLPATDAHNKLTVTYAIGGVDSDAAPTVLFIGGMFTGRLFASLTDHVAQCLGMRIVVVDRPGMGGSTTVDVSMRLSVWLEMVPVLMHTVNAQHISIAAHSCGAIYALNTLYKMPWILPPSNQKLILFSPWVSPAHSGVTMLSISSYLPSPLINKFDIIVRFVNNTVIPAVRFSGQVSNVAIRSCKVDQESGGPKDGSRTKSLPRLTRDDICWDYCGVSTAENSIRSKELMRATFAENTRGANHEVLLCLRKGVAERWGACDDYKQYPDALEAKIRAFFIEGYSDTGSLTPITSPFVIRTFWAEKDILIEKKGRKYFDKCFERFADGTREAASDRERQYLLYKTEVVSETNHDTVCLPQYGAFSKALRYLRDID